jgi:predicted lipid-binding transport protein (Tim44 family)
MLGGMLFSSLGFGSGFGGGLGGSGIGLFEIILVLGIGFLIYRTVSKKRREENLSYQTSYKQGGYQGDIPPAYNSSQPFGRDTVVADDKMLHIRRMDPGFDEARFKDNVMDTFFSIQGAWMNRDLSSVAGLFTDDMKSVFQEDIDKMLRDKKINRLENIAVRNVEIAEAWQEAGQDFITALIFANLLDYTTDDVTGQVVAGSKTEPVKFEEFWTFTRSVGNNLWRLSAINQA